MQWYGDDLWNQYTFEFTAQMRHDYDRYKLYKALMHQAVFDEFDTRVGYIRNVEFEGANTLVVTISGRAQLKNLNTVSSPSTLKAF